MLPAMILDAPAPEIMRWDACHPSGYQAFEPATELGGPRGNGTTSCGLERKTEENHTKTLPWPSIGANSVQSCAGSNLSLLLLRLANSYLIILIILWMIFKSCWVMFFLADNRTMPWKNLTLQVPRALWRSPISVCPGNWKMTSSRRTKSPLLLGQNGTAETCQGLLNVPWLGYIGHHLIVAIIDHIPNGI